MNRGLGGGLVVLALGALAAGCSLNPLPEKDAKCDLRPAKDQCTDWREFSGPSFATAQGVCGSLQGTFAEGATCDMTGVIGGCQSTSGDGSKQTNWYYLGEKYKTAEDAKQECQSQDFVTP